MTQGIKQHFTQPGIFPGKSFFRKIHYEHDLRFANLRTNQHENTWNCEHVFDCRVKKQRLST